MPCCMEMVVSNYNELPVSCGHELEKPVDKKRAAVLVLDVLGT